MRAQSLQLAQAEKLSVQQSAGRSQMAAARLIKLSDPRKVRAVSAGTQPGERVHPEVVQVMREEGIDLSIVKPQFLSSDLAQQATLLVTMAAATLVPTFPASKNSNGLYPIPKDSPSNPSDRSETRFVGALWRWRRSTAGCSCALDHNSDIVFEVQLSGWPFAVSAPNKLRSRCCNDFGSFA